MGTKDLMPEILFGKICCMFGYVSRDEMAECVKIQQSQSRAERKTLGQIMIGRRLLTHEQLSEVLAIQTKNLHSQSLHKGKLLEDIITGRLMLKYGKVTEAQINDALRLQAMREEEGQYYRLGEILVEQGIVSIEDVIEMLEIQNKAIMVCPGCRLRFNVADFEPGKRYRCKRCGTILTMPEKVDSVDVETTIFLAYDEMQKRKPKANNK